MSVRERMKAYEAARSSATPTRPPPPPAPEPMYVQGDLVFPRGPAHPYAVVVEEVCLHLPKKRFPTETGTFYYRVRGVEPVVSFEAYLAAPPTFSSTLATPLVQWMPEAMLHRHTGIPPSPEPFLFVSLPTALLGRVFCFLTLNNATVLSTMCKAFYAASRDPSLWRARCEDAGVAAAKAPGDDWMTTYQLHARMSLKVATVFHRREGNHRYPDFEIRYEFVWTFCLFASHSRGHLPASTR